MTSDSILFLLEAIPCWVAEGDYEGSSPEDVRAYLARELADMSWDDPSDAEAIACFIRDLMDYPYLLLVLDQYAQAVLREDFASVDDLTLKWIHAATPLALRAFKTPSPTGTSTENKND